LGMSSDDFTEREIQILKDMKPKGYSYKKIQEFLPDRSLGVIARKARSLGLVKKKPKIKKYSKEEEDYITQNINEKSYKEIALALNRSVDAIKQKVFKMGLTEDAPEEWTNEDDELLKEKIGEGLEMSDILHLFDGRSIQALRIRSWSLGLKARELQKERRRKQKTKFCNICDEEKCISEFYIDSRYNLPSSKCKLCQIDYSAKWKIDNPEHAKITRENWVNKNAIVLVEYYRNYHQENIIRRKRQSKLWREKPENQANARLRSKLYYKNNREKVRKYFNEVWKPKNLEKLLVDKRQHYNENREVILANQAERLRHINVEKTAQLIQFYKEHEIPEYKWHKSEFALEEDFQSALAHALVNKFDLNVELEVIIGEFGRPDIYLPDLDLFLEIKLTSFKWTKKQIVEQVAKYNEVEETWIVCLDTAPEWAIETSIPWFTPDNLFGFFKDFNFKA